MTIDHWNFLKLKEKTIRYWKEQSDMSISEIPDGLKTSSLPSYLSISVPSTPFKSTNTTLIVVSRLKYSWQIILKDSRGLRTLKSVCVLRLLLPLYLSFFLSLTPTNCLFLCFFGFYLLVYLHPSNPIFLYYYHTHSQDNGCNRRHQSNVLGIVLLAFQIRLPSEYDWHLFFRFMKYFRYHFLQSK